MASTSSRRAVARPRGVRSGASQAVTRAGRTPRPGATLEAADVLRKVFKRSGRKARPMMSIWPTTMAATKAPLIEPMPPMTMMTKATIRPSSATPLFPEPSGGAALHRAEPADDDDDEGHDQDVVAHADLHRAQGRGHQAGQTGEHR